jgi:hypothetical protein
MTFLPKSTLASGSSPALQHSNPLPLPPFLLSGSANPEDEQGFLLMSRSCRCAYLKWIIGKKTLLRGI